MKIFKLYFPIVLVGLLISLLLTNFLSVDLAKVPSCTANKFGETNIDKDCFFSQANFLPFSNTGSEVSRCIDGFAHENTIKKYHVNFHFKIMFDSQISLENLNNSIFVNIENIAKRRLQGYYLYSLNKLLI